MTNATDAASFICERCGKPFTLATSTLLRFPGWRPRLCTRCRAEAGDIAKRGPRKRSAASRAAGSVRGVFHTTAEVLERYQGGPQSGVFTDGSCSGNPGPGGWGSVRVEEGAILAERHGHEPATTNNRMELTAMAEGLLLVGVDEAVDVFSDSRLVVQTLTQWAAAWERRGWKRATGEVQNLELVQRAYALAKARPRVRIQWIRSHDGSRWNEYADALATSYLRQTL